MQLRECGRAFAATEATATAAQTAAATAAAQPPAAPSSYAASVAVAAATTARPIPALALALADPTAAHRIPKLGGRRAGRTPRGCLRLSRGGSHGERCHRHGARGCGVSAPQPAEWQPGRGK